MGDRTGLTVTIYDCPKDQVGAVLLALEEYHLELDELTLGEVYQEYEVYCGSSDELAAVLVNTAPGASWEVYEDPKYEWLGSINRYTPALGRWSAACDSEGSAVFNAEQVLKLMADLGPDAPISKLREALGGSWEDALVDLAVDKGGDVLKAPVEVAEMYARVSEQGTACAGTALCDMHVHSAALRAEFADDGDSVEPPIGPWVNCTQNEALECQVCGGMVRQ